MELERNKPESQNQVWRMFYKEEFTVDQAEKQTYIITHWKKRNWKIKRPKYRIKYVYLGKGSAKSLSKTKCFIRCPTVVEVTVVELRGIDWALK